MSDTNIVRGRNSQQPPAGMQQPPMPVPQRPERPSDSRALHPAAIAIDGLYAENAQLKKTIDELTNDLIVSRENLQQAQLALDFERQRVMETDRWKEVYQRYAVEINKGLRDGLGLIEKAMKMAMELAQKGEAEPAKAIDHIAEEARKQAVADALNVGEEPQS